MELGRIGYGGRHMGPLPLFGYCIQIKMGDVDGLSGGWQIEDYVGAYTTKREVTDAAFSYGLNLCVHMCDCEGDQVRKPSPQTRRYMWAACRAGGGQTGGGGLAARPEAVARVLAAAAVAAAAAARVLVALLGLISPLKRLQPQSQQTPLAKRSKAGGWCRQRGRCGW